MQSTHDRCLCTTDVTKQLCTDEDDLKIALMPPSREWTCNQISIVQDGRPLSHLITLERQGTNIANMHKLDHCAAIEV